MSRNLSAQQHPIELMVLNAVFDAGGQIALADLRAALPIIKAEEMHKAVTRQASLGNLKGHVWGEPVTLTASARAAIAAGRAHQPMLTIAPPDRRIGLTRARQLDQAIRAVLSPSPSERTAA